MGRGMAGKTPGKLFDLRELSHRVPVFRDRASAGKVLAGMLEAYRDSNALILAIPAGGVAVATVMAKELNLPLDVAVVSKITLPWNSEAGYGAVAFDGTVVLNEGLLSRLHLSPQEIQEGVRKTKQKVTRRNNLLRGDRPFPNLNRPVILVDDGLASGFTLRVAIKAIQNAGNKQTLIAVPTAHHESLETILDEVEAVYCPNVRGGSSFAVADAYEYWRDLEEQEIAKILSEFNLPPKAKKSP